MKTRILSFLVSVLTFPIFAQISFQETSPGVVEVVYAGEFSLFDPAGASEVYVYLWVDPMQTNPELPEQFNDDWDTSTQLVVLTDLDGFGQSYSGSINFNSHDFIEEGVIPMLTTVNDFNFILRDQSGDNQGSDYVASSFGFSGTTTLLAPSYLITSESYYADGVFYIKGFRGNQNIEFQVINLLGEKLYADRFIVSSDKIQVRLEGLSEGFAIVFIRVNETSIYTKKILL